MDQSREALGGDFRDRDRDGGAASGPAGSVGFSVLHGRGGSVGIPTGNRWNSRPMFW